MKGKIAIIGAGHVGSHVARALAAGQVCGEVVLIDKVAEKARAQAMDVADALSFPPVGVTVRDGNLDDCADSDVVFVAIGKPREPGQTRLDLLGDSVRMICGLADDLNRLAPRGVVVSITNPCDIVADVLRRRLGLPRGRVFGTGTLLDTARLVRVLSEQTGAPRSAVQAFVLGEHGDSSTIPFSAVRVNGRPAGEVEGIDRAEALDRTHMIGMDIIEGKGSTEFGIGQAAAYLARQILEDTGAVLPLSISLEGEYGLRGLSCGVPCAVGRDGVRQVIELPLEPDERAALEASANVIRKHIRLADEIAAGM